MSLTYVSKKKLFILLCSVEVEPKQKIKIYKIMINQLYFLITFLIKIRITG